MSAPSPVIRRARRTDFTATMRVLAASGVPVPPPDRATLHRFRKVVADLGADFYVALHGAELVGLVHVTYSRRLTTAARAHIDVICVAPEHRRRGVGGALLRFVHRRAAKRDCAFLAHDTSADDAVLTGLLRKHGLAPSAHHWRLALSPPTAHAPVQETAADG